MHESIYPYFELAQTFQVIQIEKFRILITLNQCFTQARIFLKGKEHIPLSVKVNVSHKGNKLNIFLFSILIGPHTFEEVSYE